MQAARGTSLNSSETTTPPSARRPSPARLIGLVAGIALTAYVVDVGTKVLAVARLEPGASYPLVGDLLQLHLTRNPGAAFSTGTEYTVALTCIAITALLVVLYLSRRLGSVVWAIAFGLLLAGIAGNLTDRLFRSPGVLRGHVIDFLMLPNWPIFNVADICINAAAVLILVQAFRGVRLDGTRTTSDETPEGDA
ncbi:signal peptidase II [Nocardioides sp.]|uniref:signal peptidase II n=1 Tax=Nocardioides sp. TaxID=35761 RepID=UPI0035643E7D